MQKHVMVDIETFGSRPGSVIASIGACIFYPDNLGVTQSAADHFYVNIDRDDSIRAGLKTDAATLKWWAERTPEARAALKDPEPIPAYEALMRFGTWLPHDPFLWSHGATFDVVLIAEAYHILGFKSLPFKYWNVRDTRTIFAAASFTIPKARGGVHHKAIDDAINQALWVCECYKHLGLTK